MFRYHMFLTFALLTFANCARVSPDLALTVRWTAWPGSRSVEVIVQHQQLEVTASLRRIIFDRRVINITPEQSEDLRRKFWRAWQHQPGPRHVPELMDGVLIEEIWHGPECTWQVGT